MELTPTGWIFLAVSIIAAVVLDLTIARFGMELFKPPSAYVFWVGRAGKLAAAVAWITYFTGHWYPTFVSKGHPAPAMIGAGAWAFMGVLLFLALITLP